MVEQAWFPAVLGVQLFILLEWGKERGLKRLEIEPSTSPAILFGQAESFPDYKTQCPALPWHIIWSRDM